MKVLCSLGQMFSISVPSKNGDNYFSHLPAELLFGNLNISCFLISLEESHTIKINLGYYKYKCECTLISPLCSYCQQMEVEIELLLTVVPCYGPWRYDN